MKTVKIKSIPKHGLPVYSTKKSAGCDLKADIPETLLIKPNARQIIPTGIYVEDIPDGYEIQIRPKSGLAAKHGITIVNSPGTVDSDYRGEIKIILLNTGNGKFSLSPGQEIAQGVLGKVEQIQWQVDNEKPVNTINEQERGDKGFGEATKTVNAGQDVEKKTKSRKSTKTKKEKVSE